MKSYLHLFEKVINKQVDIMGKDLTFEQAKIAGLSISNDGLVESYVGDPQVVLLKLIKNFVSSGRVEALQEVTNLINEIVGEEPSVEKEEIA